MRADIITIFEPMFAAIGEHGVTSRALTRQLFTWHFWNPRDVVQTNYKSVDDRPYGGGPGMVMMAPPLAQTIDAVRADQISKLGAAGPVIYLSPQGLPVTQQRIAKLATLSCFTLLCGRYEGVDERLLASRVDEEISVGDCVVTGGELPAMILLDAAIRLLPGALHDERSAPNDSFVAGLLDHPHYTRPEVFEGTRVPDVLSGGNHALIDLWRREQAIVATAIKRPDLIDAALKTGELSAKEWQQVQTQLKNRTT